MSTTQLNVPTPGQPPIVSLPTHHLACRGCGVSVPAGGDVVRVAIGSHWERIPGGSVGDQHVVTEYLDLAACDRCDAVRVRAAAVLASHRVLQRVFGGVAFERIEGALLALDLLGAELPALRSADDVVRLVGYVHGAGVAFEALQRTDVCSSSRWAHVTDEARQTLRDGVARWLRARTAPVVDPLGPPEDSALRACMICGVDRAEVWEALSSTRRALGGAVSPGWMQPVEGDVCGRCADAVQAVGSVGRTAMTRAVLAHLGVARGLASETVELHMVGWGALPAGTAPNRSPWAHIDTSALRADLRMAGVA